MNSLTTATWGRCFLWLCWLGLVCVRASGSKAKGNPTHYFLSTGQTRSAKIPDRCVPFEPRGRIHPHIRLELGGGNFTMKDGSSDNRMDVCDVYGRVSTPTGLAGRNKKSNLTPTSFWHLATGGKLPRAQRTTVPHSSMDQRPARWSKVANRQKGYFGSRWTPPALRGRPEPGHTLSKGSFGHLSPQPKWRIPLNGQNTPRCQLNVAGAKPRWRLADDLSHRSLDQPETRAKTLTF